MMGDHRKGSRVSRESEVGGGGSSFRTFQILLP